MATDNHVHAGCRARQKYHRIDHQEVNRWFRVWGIIGERRPPVIFLKAVQTRRDQRGR